MQFCIFDSNLKLEFTDEPVSNDDNEEVKMIVTRMTVMMILFRVMTALMSL